ncbi:LacI family DNA-binding transcriptional regulator [uncultured Clostridium sp.]|uniref:LacI family DNA-binding transcriptional regulator n=1 Tax=uncultured Clostridium sp. TaxID=59620 RepID=UPI0025D43B15|nr:LacI family DNA-binding transcriptional regulator [uncultured Clostridium sp.]
MEEISNRRVTIKDIAEELGVSTATVSNVINGKTKKISDKTVERVQKKLEEKHYIPNMAGILLAQNSSKIMCVVIANHIKYEGKILQDPFISALMDSMSLQAEKNDYFMMIKISSDINDIIRYASMWNMAGLILTGFCAQDYNSLRKRIHIPFVVMDGFFEPEEKCANVSIDDFNGGFLMGKYLIRMGHRKIIYLSDNDMCMDHNRYMGLKQSFIESSLNEKDIHLEIIPMESQKRRNYYALLKKKIKDYTAIFCASDAYAIEVINYFVDNGYSIPRDISIAGFDDIPAAEIVRPALTTIRQDINLRAEKAMAMLNGQINGTIKEKSTVLPVELVERNSVACIINDQYDND